MARGIKNVELTERDRFLLYLLDKFRVLDTKSLTILGYFSSEQYATKRLLKLAKYNYLKRKKLATELPIIHYLTLKGNDEINDRRTRNNPRLATLEHELTVGRVASFLWSKFDIDPLHIITDRELRQYEKDKYDVRVMERKGDLLFIDKDTKKRTVVEVELTFKGKSRTIKNINRNRQFNDRQIWFIRKTMRGLKRVLLESNVPESDIIYLENIDLNFSLLDRELNDNFEEFDTFKYISEYFDTFNQLSDIFSVESIEKDEKIEQKNTFFDRFR